MYKVVREYAGIEEGTTIKAKDKPTIEYMVGKGYWKAIEEKPLNKAIETKPKVKRKKRK